MQDSEADLIQPKQAIRRQRKNRLARLMRWAHIYVSMLGLAVTLFFGVTGITLNHAGWFFGESEMAITIKDSIGDALLAELQDPNSTTARLSVAENLRSKHQLGGAVKEFTVDEFQSVIAFAGPGYSADVFVDNETGDYEITEIKQGFIAIINDLHKGRDTGPAWSLLIDVSAVLLCLISATGLMLIFWLRLRRSKGLLTMISGTVLAVLVYWFAVP